MRLLITPPGGGQLRKATGHLGYAGGLPVIAIGPKGGKIVGYHGGDHKKPIYAGSGPAAQLATDQAKAEGKKKPGKDAHGHFTVAEWLETLESFFGVHASASGVGEYVLTAKSASALKLALSAFGGVSSSAVTQLSDGHWSAVAQPMPGKAIHDPAVDPAAAPKLVEKPHSKPPAGWPADTPPPGTTIRRSYGGFSYLLHVAISAGGKPSYVVTAPAGAPLYLFTTAAHGEVTGTIGGDEPVTVAFTTASVAAEAIVGAKTSLDGKHTKKAQSGPRFFGWKAPAGQTPPIVVDPEDLGAVEDWHAHATSAPGVAEALAAHGVAWEGGKPQAEPEKAISAAWKPEVPSSKSEMPAWYEAAPPGTVLKYATGDNQWAKLASGKWQFSGGDTVIPPLASPSNEIALQSGKWTVVPGDAEPPVPEQPQEQPPPTSTAGYPGENSTPQALWKWLTALPVGSQVVAGGAVWTAEADGSWSSEAGEEKGPASLAAAGGVKPHPAPAAEQGKQHDWAGWSSAEPPAGATKADVYAWLQSAPVGAQVKIGSTTYELSDIGSWWGSAGEKPAKTTNGVADAWVFGKSVGGTAKVVGHPPPAAPPAPPSPAAPPAGAPAATPADWPAWAPPVGAKFTPHTAEYAPGGTHTVEVVSGPSGPEYHVYAPGMPAHVYGTPSAAAMHLGLQAFAEDIMVSPKEVGAELVKVLGGDADAYKAAQAATAVGTAPEGWSAPVPPGFKTTKTLGKLAKAPGSSGKTVDFQIVAGAHGEPSYQVTFPAGGEVHIDPATKKAVEPPIHVAPGQVLSFSSASMAGKAVTGTETNGLVFFGITPNKAGKTLATVVDQGGSVVEPAPAAPTTEMSGDDAHALLFDESMPMKPVEPPPVAGQHNWAGWISDAPAKSASSTSKMKWLNAAPVGASVALHDGVTAVKGASGEWEDSKGSSYESAAAVYHDVVWGKKAAKQANATAKLAPKPPALPVADGAPVVGPDGKSYPPGTTFKSVEVVTTALDALTGDVTGVFGEAVVEPNPKYAGWYTVKIPVTALGAGATADGAAAKLKPVVEAHGAKFGKSAYMGGTYCYLNFGVVEPHAVVKTETIHYPVLPAAKASNYEEIHDESRFAAGDMPWLGVGIDMDGGQIRDQVVTVTKKAAGVREVRMKLTNTAQQAAMQAFQQGAPGTWEIGKGKYNPKTGVVSTPKATDAQGTKIPTRTLSGNGWTAHLAMDSGYDAVPWAHVGSLKIDVQPGTTVATALAELEEKAGLPGFSNPPSEDDREALRLRKLLWNVSPADHNAIFGVTGTLTAPTPKVRAALKKHLTDEQIDGAHWRQSSSGHRSLYLDDGEAWVAGGSLGLYHNWYSADPKDVVAKLVQGGGNVCTETRWKTGMGGAGASSKSDETTGGASYVFHYNLKGNQPTPHGLHVGTGITLLYGPDVVERADWHSSVYDNFGSTSASNNSFTSRPARAAAAGDAREVMVQSATDLHDIRAIYADTETKRQGIIDEFKQQGVTALGGVPVEQVVVTSFAAAKALVKQRWSETLTARKATEAVAA